MLLVIDSKFLKLEVSSGVEKSIRINGMHSLRLGHIVHRVGYDTELRIPQCAELRAGG